MTINSIDDILELSKKVTLISTYNTELMTYLSEPYVRDNVEYYKKNTDRGVLNDLRLEIADKILKDGSINEQEYNAIYNKHKEEKPNGLKSWSNPYKICYSLFFKKITNEVSSILNNFVIDILSDINLSNKFKFKVVDFDGSQYQGQDLIWIAIFNNIHKSHKDGYQIAINIKDGKMFAHIYDPKNKSSDNLKEIKHNYSDNIKNYINKFQNVLFDISNQSEHSNKNSQPLNQILYGPPGTGKTYNTISMAVDIIEGKVDGRTYSDSKVLYEKFLNEGRIKFVTFHQNYSYEDFVEGLRPDVDSGALSFIKNKGIFKDLCFKARTFDQVESKMPFEDAFEGLLGDIIDGSRDHDNPFEVQMPRVKYRIDDISDDSIGFTKASGGNAHRLSISKIQEMYESEELITKAGGLKWYYNSLVKLLLDYGKTASDNNINQRNTNNFVLIIDEINRANISRVFGELITLIESDKRAGHEHAMSVTLPSGDPFSVPNNLYIIGTMNTADKSIALLDIALRRRFEFKPMYPKYDIQDENGINIINQADFLQKLNQTICSEEFELGRDLQIGHSYFIDDNFNFYNTLRNKVVPLLLEYTMNDEDAVNRLLEKALPETLKDKTSYLMPWVEYEDGIETIFNS